jgi:hypothetical protein
MIRLLTWNLNHRARPRRVGHAITEAIASLRPDLVALTEYVEGPSHADFLAQLSARGFPHVCVSNAVAAQN